MGTGFPEHHRLIPALAGWTRRLVSSDIQKLAPWRHRKLTPEETAYVVYESIEVGLDGDG